jgi:Uma2 family endonuclease
MSSTPVLIPVEEYLNTAYRPDCDYIDGQVLERNMGETPHSGLQSFLVRRLGNLQEEWRVDVLTEQRVQVDDLRYRIPDICLVSHDDPFGPIIRTPPVLCIEILSSADTLKTIQERLDDYARMGVPCSWVVDPWKRAIFFCGPDGILHPAIDTLTVPGTPISTTTQSIFSELDRLERRALQP